MTNRKRYSLLPLAMLLALVSAVGAQQAAEDGKVDARKILNATDFQGGLLVYIGKPDADLAAALARDESAVVQVLATDARGISRARRKLQDRGLYGRVTIRRWHPSQPLPYADHTVNAIATEQMSDLLTKETPRVLVPHGQVASREGDRWSGGRTHDSNYNPPKTDSWTHFMHDASGNAVADDEAVGPPKGIRWSGAPKWSRSHEVNSSLAAMVADTERIYYVFDEGLTGITDGVPVLWTLICRDAYNGTVLWKRRLPQWGGDRWRFERLWSLPECIGRRLVTADEKVYITLDYDGPVVELDGTTGEELRRFPETERTEEMVILDGTLLARVTKGEGEGVRATDLETGETRELARVEEVLPFSLAAAGGCVVFHDRQAVHCYEIGSGEQVWRVENPVEKEWLQRALTMAIGQGVAVFVCPDHMTAFELESGEVLWQRQGEKGNRFNAQDLFIIDGVVWPHRREYGLDLRSGKQVASLDVRNLISPGHHHRCYRSKATRRYQIWPKRGAEFVDLKQGEHMRHDWLRGACLYGVMPANGQLIVSPDPCFCYPGVKINGFFGLSAEPSGADEPYHAEGNTGRTEPLAGPGDWPTYRGDGRRSGAVAAAPSGLDSVAWSAQVGQKLSQPVLAGGLVFVADVDAHRVVCLDAATGEQQWSFTADGRVDSPPSIHEGLAIFGSADGHLYALGARDGVFRWRRRLAPGRAQVVSFGQLESVWPVHGSVLVKDGLVYATAGRSSYLDGGIRVFALEPRTGEIVHETTLEGPVPELPEEQGRPFDMDGTNSDILVTDGEYIYMQQIVLNNELERQSTERLSHMGDQKVGRHLFATGGFLNASLFNRIYWGYWSRWPGFYLANQAPKSGQILVHDDERTYAVRYFAERYRLGSRYIPGGPGCLVTADDNDNEPLLYDGKSEPRPIKWLPFETKGKRGNYASKAENVNKGTGFTRSQKPVWMEWVAVRVHGLVLAGDRLVLAGAPDELDPEDPMAGFEGRNGCVLQVLDTTTGKVVEQRELDSPPVWDGMCAAQGRLYVSTMDGRVLCLGAAAE